MPRPADMPGTGHPHAFAPALLDPETPDPSGVVGPTGNAAPKRFAVYRNNVASGLVDALADIFPVVRRLVGEEYFRAMASIYARQDPPRSKLLFQYGAGFASFLETFEPAGRLPYLPDTARLERAWLDAYHAADTAPLAAQALSAVAPDDLPSTRFIPHPAARIVRSPFAVVSIFEANRAAALPGRVDAGEAQDALVTRPALSVEVHRLAPGQAACLTALMRGAALHEAVEAANAEAEEFDFSAALVLMLRAGVFQALDAGPAAAGREL